MGPLNAHGNGLAGLILRGSLTQYENCVHLTINMKRSFEKQKSGDASSSYHLQGNLPRKGESKTRVVSEPSASADFGPECRSLIVSNNTLGAASLSSPGGKQRVMLPGKWNCKVCHKEFPSRRNLHRHLKLLHQHKKLCLFCKEMFATHFELKCHIKKFNHQMQSYQCPSYNCPKRYHSLLQLQIHCDLTHPQVCIRKCNCTIHNKFDLTTAT